MVGIHCLRLIEKKGKALDRLMILVGSLAGGGAERAASSLANYLAEKTETTVTLVTFSKSDDDFYRLNENINRVGLDLSKRHSGVLKIYSLIIRLVAIRAILRKSNITAAIGYMHQESIMLTLASLGLKIRVIATERSYPPKDHIDIQWNILRRYVYRYSHVVVAQTNETAKWLKENTKAKKIEVIPNSSLYPLPKSHPIECPSQYLDKDKKIILAVGSDIYVKGFDRLINVFSKIEKKIKTWELVIVGIRGNNNINEIHNHLKIYNCENRVRIIPSCGNIVDWYKRSEIFILSSRYEGMPNVLIEAMSYGCACISFDCETGPNDLIKNNKNGLLVVNNDLRELENSILKLCYDELLRKRLSTEAVKIRKSHSPNKINKMWINLLIKK